MDYAIGIDIGGTSVKSVCVSASGEVLSREVFSIVDDAQHAWDQDIKRHVEAVQKNFHHPAKWIGVAAPGLARPDGRCIGWMQGRLDAVQGLDWTDLICGTGFQPVQGAPTDQSRTHGLKTRATYVPVLNDAQAALMGEVWQGAAAGATNAVLLTLGTGVGGAIMCDGRLLRGAIGRAGHLGHICLDPAGERDIVNTPGSLEMFIGNYTIEQRTGSRFGTTHELVAAHRAGDADATKLWLRSIHHLACGIVSIINAVDPETIILGGGVMAAGDTLLNPLHEELDKYEWRPHGHKVKIVAASLGEFAGAIGAAYNATKVTAPV